MAGGVDMQLQFGKESLGFVGDRRLCKHITIPGCFSQLLQLVTSFPGVPTFTLVTTQNIHIFLLIYYVHQPFFGLQPLPRYILKLTAPFQSLLFDTVPGNIYLGKDMKIKKLQLPAQPIVCPTAIPSAVPLCNAASIEDLLYQPTDTEGVVSPHSASTASLPLIKNICQ